MKYLFKYLLAVLVLTMLASVQLLGQEWSEKQQEVWKNVQTYWDLDAKHDLDGFMSYFHEDYSGWYNPDALPAIKAETRQAVSNEYAASKVVYQQIKPVAIKIHDNIAIVHYYYDRMLQNNDGNQNMERGNWTDILMKQGAKWVLIGDHGGPMPDED